MRLPFYDLDEATQPAVLSLQGFRFSLQAGIPVPGPDQTGIGFGQIVPATSNQMTLYYGGRWLPYTSDGFTTPAFSGMTAGIPRDVFCYWTGSAIASEQVAWTNATTRATDVVLVNGVWVKNGDATRRHLATFVPTGATSAEDSNLKRLVWNRDNRVQRYCAVALPGPHNYNVDTLREWGGGTYRISFVTGFAGGQFDVIQFKAYMEGYASAVGNVTVFGLGIDAVAENARYLYHSSLAGQLFTAPVVETFTLNGYHQAIGVQRSSAVGTTTFYGGNLLTQIMM